eukprot:10640716-Alexandrium_andersonii.AAC.1
MACWELHGASAYIARHTLRGTPKSRSNTTGIKPSYPAACFTITTACGHARGNATTHQLNRTFAFKQSTQLNKDHIANDTSNTAHQPTQNTYREKGFPPKACSKA